MTKGSMRTRQLIMIYSACSKACMGQMLSQRQWAGALQCSQLIPTPLSTRMIPGLCIKQMSMSQIEVFSPAI